MISGTTSIPLTSIDTENSEEKMRKTLLPNSTHTKTNNLLQLISSVKKMKTTIINMINNS